MSFIFMLTIMRHFLPFYCGFYFYKIQGKNQMAKVRMSFFDCGNVISVTVTVTGYCLLNSRLNEE